MNFEKHQSMNKSVSILDKEYKEWVKDLALRYRNSQIKAAVKVNTEMLKFYWELGKDIVELHAEKRWGDCYILRHLKLCPKLGQNLPKKNCPNLWHDSNRIFSVCHGDTIRY